MVKTAIVDDTDPNIVYDQGWKAVARTYSITSNEFNSTFHHAASNGLTMRYSFRGTGITVYGTLTQPATYGTPGSTYSIDDGPPYRFNSTGDVINTGDPTTTFSHIPFYRSPTLPYGDHSILITVDNVEETTKRKYYFDFFTVEGVQDEDNAQGTGSTNGPGFTIVDDRDSRVSYSGGWTTTGSGTSTDYGTTTSTTPSGQNGNVNFRFTGTDVAVYGRIYDHYGQADIAQFTIDGGTADQIVKTVAVNGMLADRRHQPLLVLDRLKEGEHTIQVTSLGEQTPPWYFDYFVYGTSGKEGSGGGVNTPEVGTGTDGVGESSISVITTTFTSGGVVVTATQTLSNLDIGSSSNDGPNSANTSNASSSTMKRAATIAGATIGVLALLSLLTFLALYWVRKKRLQTSYVPYRDPEDEKDLGSAGMGTDGGGSGSGGQLVNMQANSAGANGGVVLDIVPNNTHGQQVRRPSRLQPPFASREKGRYPLPHAGTNEYGMGPRSNSPMTVVNSVITSGESDALEEQDSASSAALLSHSSSLPNTESIHPAGAQATGGNMVLTLNAVVVPGGGMQGPVKPSYNVDRTNQQPLSPTSPLNQQQQQLQHRPPYVTRQRQGVRAVREEDTLGIGREVDSGIRLDPMQFNLTTPDLLPPSYSSTTYRP
ncbi:hypothetical protein FRB91_003697 [Serendipita sp. 411]|nr:hypothetical protein FRB91_003697 [Serendipita sp. 411]